MNFLKRNFKRFAVDAAGYGLILLGAALGWLPGPGGIPLVIAGLGLLSINNEWAERLRQYLLKHGGKFAQILFPTNVVVQWLYDFLAVASLGLVAVLAWHHDALWQLSLATALFFFAIFVAAMNRERFSRFKRKN